jgi:hypothetical protein
VYILDNNLILLFNNTIANINNDIVYEPINDDIYIFGDNIYRIDTNNNIIDTMITITGYKDSIFNIIDGYMYI